MNEIGIKLFREYAFAFEATSVLILVAMVGAIILARKESAVMRLPEPTLNSYLMLSAVLFAIGTAGVFLRRNLITILLSVEVMLNAVNLTFVAVGSVSRLGRRADHRVLRHDRRRRRGRRRAGHRHRAVPAQGNAEPGRVHVAEVVTACCT